jgi:AraC-like DNA-binding protein
VTLTPDIAERQVDGFDESEDAMSGVCAPMRVRPAGDRPFTGAFRGTRIGDVLIARVRNEPCTVVRSAGLVRSTDPELLKLVFLEAGRVAIEQDGRRSLLDPGDMAVYETVRPYELRCLSAVESVIVAVPISALGAYANIVSRHTAVAAPSDTWLRAAIGGFLRDLVDVPGPSNHSAGRYVADALVSLVIAQLTDVLPAAAPDGLADRVLAYCLAHLSDPELSVEAVARAHRISVRYLHKILQPREVTLSAWIRRHRLERIRRDLANPALADQTVPAIAARWGVLDATHVSRALKAEFGQTAADIRRYGIRDHTMEGLGLTTL